MLHSALHLRAEILGSIRDFFSRHNVLEVETPCLESAPTSDPHIEPMTVNGYYLRASPEFSMKRLLTNCNNDIYQIGKVFRESEISSLHNPEFTMLEWYRRHWDYQRLMTEVDEILHCLFGLRKGLSNSEFVLYREIFTDVLGVNPWDDEAEVLIAKAQELGFEACYHYRDALNFLMDTVARTSFSKTHLTFVSDYPAEQALLARVTGDITERFEVYFGKIELVNAYTELTDGDEYRRRFLLDNDFCAEVGKPKRIFSEDLLKALDQGLPDCAGASLGIDRALMCVAGVDKISETLTFDWNNA